MKKSRAEFLFIIFQLCFDMHVLFFLISLILQKLKAEKSALKILTKLTYEYL